MDLDAIIQYVLAFIGIYISIFFLLFFFQKYGETVSPHKKSTWEPLVSIIIPAYNEGETIKACIRTILASDYPKSKLEIIVVDDGSKDSTAREASSLAAQNVTVIQKANSGKAASMNVAIPLAKGEVIATMDADSYVEPDTIRKLLDLFDAPDVMAVTAAVQVRKSKHLLSEFQRIEYLFIIFMRRMLSFMDSVSVTPGPFSMFRASVFREIGLFDTKTLVEDHEMALRIQKHNYKIRSSIDAKVYTDVPKTVSSLLIQRVRWQRGGLHNIIRYRELISPKYGDFGMFAVPLTLLSTLLVFGMTYLFVKPLLFPSYYAQVLGFDALFLGADAFAFIGIALFVLSFVWSYVVLKAMEKEGVSIPFLFVYLLFYWYFSVAYNFAVLWKEIKREKFSWDS